MKENNGKYIKIDNEKGSLTAPFWPVNLRTDGARAIDEAAAAAATRILQKRIHNKIHCHFIFHFCNTVHYCFFFFFGFKPYITAIESYSLILPFMHINIFICLIHNFLLHKLTKSSPLIYWQLERHAN